MKSHKSPTTSLRGNLLNPISVGSASSWFARKTNKGGSQLAGSGFSCLAGNTLFFRSEQLGRDDQCGASWLFCNFMNRKESANVHSNRQ
jgi:hypothetical protein